MLPAMGWQALGSLEVLDLYQHLSGQLAAAFPDSLQELDLISNSLTFVSPDWRPPPHLRKLSLLNNQLNQTLGEQRSWLAAAAQVQLLSLGDNSLHGTLPADLALPPALISLDLNGNQLSGEVCCSRLANACSRAAHANDWHAGGMEAAQAAARVVWHVTRHSHCCCCCRHPAAYPPARRT